MAELRQISLISSVLPNPVAVIPTTKSSHETNPEPKDVLFQAVYFDIKQLTEQSNPIYDFEKLFAAQKKSLVSENRLIDDSFGEKDEEGKLNKLAKHFEAKYGSVGPRDLDDLGEGYDQNDSFVDNADQNEAAIPLGWTTQLGGFYVGTGPLYIRQLRPKEEEAHVYESVSIEECLAEMRAANDAKVKRKTVELESDHSEEEEVQLRRKRSTTNFDNDKLDIAPSEVAKTLKPKTVATLSAKRSTPKKFIKIMESTPSKSSEEVTLVSELGNSISILRPISKEIEAEQRLVSDTGKALQSSEGKWDPNSSTASDDTSPALRALIDKLTHVGQTWDGGKRNFFSVEHNPDINDLFLKLECECRRLRHGLRSAIYSYLADNLPFTKNTLMKHARKLREADVEAKNTKILKQLGKVLQSEPEFGNGIDPTSKHFKAPIRRLIRSAVKHKLEVYDVKNSGSATQTGFIRGFVDSELFPLWANRNLEKESLYSEALPKHSPKRKSTSERKQIVSARRLPLNRTPTESATVSARRSSRLALTPTKSTATYEGNPEISKCI